MLKPATHRLPESLLRRMIAFRKETGISQSEQIRRGMDAWLSEQEQFRAQLKGSLKLAKGGR